jgi:hypothetical protein
VFFALVDLVTYLIYKVGQGYNFLLFPMLMSYGAMGHLILASSCSAGAPNSWMYIKMVVSTISPISTIVDGG